MNFGPGSQLAAQCPRVPDPDGWRPWTDADGPIPDALAKRVQALTDDQTVPVGSTEGYPLPGVTVLIRVEPHVWSRDAQGNLLEGCYRSSGLYLPLPLAPVVTPTDTGSSGLAKATAVLMAASLAVGIAATVKAWNKS